MEPNIHQIKKNNLDGFNVEVFYNSAVRWFIYTGRDCELVVPINSL